MQVDAMGKHADSSDLAPLKVAMIGQRGIPASYGGVERAVEELAARLADRGHDVTVFCRRGDHEDEPRQYRSVRLRYVRVVNGKHIGQLLQSGLASLAVIGGRYDIVHYHAMGPTLFSPIARWCTRAAVVNTVQGRDDQRAKWGRVAKRLLAVAAWTSAKISHRTIVVSRALQDDFQVSFNRASTYVPNGIASQPREDAGDTLDLLDLKKHRYLLHVGRLVPEKGVDLLLRAYAKVDTDLPLVIVGDAANTEGYVAELHRMAANDSRIRLVGPRFGPALAELFTNAMAFVQPSHLEGLPIALLEAIEYGLPVIVSDIGPHLEVVGDDHGPGRRVFPDDNLAGLCDALDAVIADPDAERVGAVDLRREVLEAYDWDTVADRTVEVYRSALTARRGA
jgi:glycosyltransferase involved in cell wall biosynthesis